MVRSVWIKVVVFPIALLMAGSSLAAGAGPSGEELQAVEEAVNFYLEGGKTGRIELLKKAFHADAEIECVKDGELVSWDLPTFLGFFDPARPSDHVYRILAVDFAGNAAAVKAEWDFGTWKYIDYLSLLKVDGRWQIVHKIFYRTRP